ncbi:MAG TPA: sigma 54-interacting transcriptional regulator, partial [Polyangiaceae bacterium]|nr:sigma 54-interacting transcriptional regulator [Polyangiaceae bacterium]
MLHDDGVFCNVVKGILTDAGYSTDICASTDAALELVDGGNYGVLIAEQRLGHTDVLSLAQQLRATHADLSVVLLVSDKTLELAIGGLQSGFFDFMTRSFDLSALGEHVLDAVARAFEGQHVASSRPGSVPPPSSSDTLDGVLIGSSASVERAREQYRCALHTDAPVVIAGEKGTEKEALARAIHEMGSRKGEPFLVVTADHGHLSVNGANHGAGNGSSGGTNGSSSNVSSNGSSNGSSHGPSASLEEAHAWRFAKGTLYFPDANALSLPAQSALVELLSGIASSSAGAESQSGERPRVIAALEQAAEESWAQSTLRRVFERVGGVRIELPSLRERGRDIALLAEHFAEQLRLSRGDAYLRITPTALEALARYHWPGNVDELRLAIQHAAS